jgi:hypothetical protein
MITGDGLVKVLDFGLAKLTEPTHSEADDIATIVGDHSSDTAAGVIVGPRTVQSTRPACGSSH